MANCENISIFNFDLVKSSKLKKKFYFWIVSSVIMVMGTLVVTNKIEYSLFALFITTFLVIQFYYPNKVSGIIEYGYKGEKNCLKLLQKLPSDFIIFNQIEIPSEKSSYSEFESDFIVVGQNSVFLVEAKKYSGKIKSEDPQREWTRYKYDKTGNQVHASIIKNPISQVMRQKQYLCEYFLHFELELNPRTIVFLDMDTKNFDIAEDLETPIFNNKAMIKYIKKVDKSSTSFINGYNRDKVIDILISLNKNSNSSRKLRLKDKTNFKKYFES